MKKTLGIKDSERFGPNYAISPIGGKKGKDPITFPRIELVGPQIEAADLDDYKVGDTCVVGFEVKIVSVEARRDDANPDKTTKRMSIELQSVVDAAEPVEEAEKEESEEDGGGEMAEDEAEDRKEGEPEDTEEESDEEEDKKPVRGKKKADRGDYVSPADSGLEDEMD